MKTELKNAIDGSEITIYDLKSIIEYIVEKNGLINCIKVSENIKYDVQEATYIIQSLGKRFADAEEILEKELDAHYERVEKILKAHNDRMRAITNASKELSKIAFPETIKLPYNLKEVFDVAERIRTMSDKSIDMLKKIFEISA